MYHSQSGQSLIELLLAIGLMAIILPALLTGFISSREGKAQEGQRLGATALLREAEEAVRSVREKDWNTFALNGTFHPVVSGSAWSLASSSESVNGYQRQIIISDAQRDPNNFNIVFSGGVTDPSTKKITVSVSWNTPSFSSVDSTTYYQRYLGNRQYFQTTQVDFNTGTGTNTTVVATGDGGVELGQGAGAGSLYGSQFLLTGTSSIGSMTSSTRKTSLRFTAQNTAIVNTVRVYLQTERGTSPAYRFGIQGNNGGNPSGIFLGSGTLTSNSAGWKTITLSPAVNITAGTVYHIVIEPSGSPTSSNYIAIRRTTPQNLFNPYSTTADSNLNTLFYNGTSWAVQNFQPMYELDFNNGTYEGNPYDSATAVNIFGANFYGEKFTVTGSDKTVTDVTFYVRKNSATNPADSLQVVLWDADTNTLIEEGVLATAAQLTTTYANRTYTFATPRTLTVGKSYRIYLQSPASNSNRYYQTYRLNNTNAANYNSINYDGTNSIYTLSTNSGTSWTDTGIYYDLADFQFTVQATAGYQNSGTFESATIDTGALGAFNNLTWGEALAPNTNIRMQLAINNDNSTWDYFGSDGQSGTFFDSTMSAIPLNRINGRFIRYKATLSGDGTATPTLNDVSINYSP